MVDVAAFRGLRYGPDVDLAEVTAPPYDAIDEDLAEELRSRHPHNVVRLELSGSSEEDREGTGRYDRARETYRAWLRDGVLRRDERPAVTVYEQRETGSDASQRGVVVAVRLEPWAARVILPHERVFPGPVADRLRLLEALPANLSPIYLVASSEPDEVARVLDQVTSEPPDGAFDDGGMGNRVWRVTDEDLIAGLRSGYADRRLLVADGHHRYTTALEHLRATGAGLPGSDRVLAYVVGDDPRRGRGPSIRPMHRVLTSAVEDPLAALRRSGASLPPVVTDGDAGDALRQLEDDSVLCVLVTRTGLAAVRRWNDEALDRLDAAVRDVDIAQVDESVVAAIATDEGAARPEPDGTEAVQRVRDGRADAAVLVRPVRLDTVWRVAVAGARMPAKSTSFSPKPRTGIVIRPLDDT